MISAQRAIEEQKILLKMEYAAEREAFRKQTETAGIARKVKRGDAWYPISIGKTYYNSMNQKIEEIKRSKDSEIEHNFEYGKPIIFFKTSPKITYTQFFGTVSYAEDDHMAIIIPDGVEIINALSGEDIGVQIYFDETTYRLMEEALNKVQKASNNKLAYLRDLFYSNKPALHFSFKPLRFPWLNETQERAVNEVLRAKDVLVVHGPPGTGKTTTLVESIFETLHRENQVLVCAQSNMAVDWISEKLVDRGVSVLRIGNPKRVTDKMLSFTYERQFENHPDYPTLWKIRNTIRQMRNMPKKSKDEGFHQKIDRLRDRATELEIRINTELFDNARVIVSTLCGSANRLLERQKFGTLFIDEAAQALEAACWIPIRKVSRVILAGDHCQLPPTVKSMAALKAGLGRTLMERIVDNKPEVVTLLRMQYRMNEDIMRFSSDWFYGGRVESAPDVKFRSVLDMDVPMEWLTLPETFLSETAGEQQNEHRLAKRGEEFVGENFGRINKAEATLTLQTLRQYFEKIGKTRILDERLDVGIISPYRAQVQFLRSQLKKKEFFKPFRHLISVNTVDGFQGQERDIILISLVRSNDEGQIGFLRDLRRMNVAITRARMKLIIIGNSATMTRHPFYKKLYEYVQNLKQTATT